MTSENNQDNNKSISIKVGGNVDNSQVIAAGGNVWADKYTQKEHNELAKAFTKIYEMLENRKNDPAVDKTEIKETVERIEIEAKKGEQASEPKIERWLNFLLEMAPDIFDVLVTTLASPITGASIVIQKIANKAKSRVYP